MNRKVPKALTREMIKAGAVQKMIAEAGYPFEILSEEQLAESRRETLGDIAPADAWIFGYGSLIWNPAFHHRDSTVGTVYGYHRKFCLKTEMGRATPECPGLTLGLEHGGSLTGVAFHVDEEEAEEEIAIVWRREMVTGAYQPRWVNVHTDRGVIRAITFVVNEHHVRYCRLPEEEVADMIARARGEFGQCSDYLYATVEHLEELGIHDRAMADLRDRVRDIQDRERLGSW